MSYVDKLVDIILPPTTNNAAAIIIGGGGRGGGGSSIDLNKSDVPAIVRAQLVSLRSQLNASLAGFTDRLSKAHLQDLSEKIKQALDPK